MNIRSIVCAERPCHPYTNLQIAILSTPQFSIEPPLPRQVDTTIFFQHIYFHCAPITQPRNHNHLQPLQHKNSPHPTLIQPSLRPRSTLSIVPARVLHQPIKPHATLYLPSIQIHNLSPLSFPAHLPNPQREPKKLHPRTTTSSPLPLPTPEQTKSLNLTSPTHTQPPLPSPTAPFPPIPS